MYTSLPDNDGDGYTQDFDCDDTNSDRHPLEPPSSIALAESVTLPARTSLLNEAAWALSQSMTGGSEQYCNSWTVGEWDYVNDTSMSSGSFADWGLHCLQQRYGEAAIAETGLWSEAEMCTQPTTNAEAIAHAGPSNMLMDLLFFRTLGPNIESEPVLALPPQWEALRGSAPDHQLRPGDVIFYLGEEGQQHIALVWNVLGHEDDCTPNLVDIIDSDHRLEYQIDDSLPYPVDGRGILARHKLGLQDLPWYRVWRNAWVQDGLLVCP